MIVGLTNVPFSENDLHRFSTNSLIIFQTTFNNSRMIKNDTLEIDISSVSYDTLLTYNYGFYQKDSKKYYFFIKGYEYINDIVLNINISVDWFTTDFTTDMLNTRSFIERIHPVLHDSEYTQIPENINFNQYEYNVQDFIIHNMDKYIIGVNFTFTPYEVLQVDSILNISTPFVAWKNCPTLCGIPQGAVFYVLDTLQEVSNVYENAINFGYTSGIVGVWRVSSDIIGDTIQNVTGAYFPLGLNVADITKITFNVNVLSSTECLKTIATYEILKPTNIGNYTPLYKKVLSDEFVQFYLQNDTTTSFYNPSQFHDEKMIVTEYASCDNNMNISLVPKRYKKGLHDNFADGLSTTFSISGVLTADNTQQNVNNLITSGFNRAVEGAIGSATSGATGGLSTVLNYTMESLHYLRGGVSNNVTTVGTGSSSFSTPQLPFSSRFFYMGTFSISEYSARLIDKYFSMFGYQVNENLTPYLRPYANYTYIKGKINIKNNVNDISKEYIKDLFSRGLTIWTDNNMYNYDV